MEIPGSLGAIVGLFGGADPVVTHNALYLQDRAFIEETGENVMVTDLGGRRLISVDHENRTYTSLTFEEMAQLTDQALQGMYAASRDAATTQGLQAADVQASRDELDQALDEAQAAINFDVSVETTNERQRFGDLEATRQFITTEFQVTVPPEGVEPQPEGGSLIVMAELWQTDDVPAVEALQAEWAETLASDPGMTAMAGSIEEATRDSGQGLATSLAGWNPQVGAGLAKTAEAISELDGTTVRSVVTVAMMAPGAELDREALLAWEPESMGATLGNAAAGAARQAAADAARGAIRGLGGIFGGGRDPEPEPSASQVPQVQPLFRVITTRTDLSYSESADDVLGALEARIADYQALTFDDLSRQLQ